MTNRITHQRPEQTEELIARFGEARLLRADGRIRLRGGSMADRAEALEWMALFLPEEVPCLER